MGFIQFTKTQTGGSIYKGGSWNVRACDVGGANSDLVPHLEVATVVEMRVRFKLRWNVSNLLRPELEGVICKGVRGGWSL